MKYIFYKDPADGMAVPTGYALDLTGNFIAIGYIVNGFQVPPRVNTGYVLSRPNISTLMERDLFIGNLRKQNLPLIPYPTQNTGATPSTANLNNSQNQNQMYNNSQNPAIVPVESVSGQLTTARTEQPYNEGGEILTLNISLDNSGAAATSQILIGDGADLIDNQLGGLTTDPAFVVGGTYGVKTLDILRSLSLRGIRMHVFQAEANASAYFSTGTPVKKLYSNIQGSIQSVVVDFNLNQDGSQFNDKIRRIGDFRFLITEMSAIFVSLEPGDVLNITMKVQSTGTAREMILSR